LVLASHRSYTVPYMADGTRVSQLAKSVKQNKARIR
jgi:hypothetical protein